MYVSRVSLENIRSFGKADLDMTVRSDSGQDAPRLRSILIGENGTGKTTLLRAIAVGLADRKDASGLLAESTGQLVAEGKSKATIEIDLRAKNGQGPRQSIKTVIRTEDGQDVLDDKVGSEALSTESLVCGYGISRANEGRGTGRPYRLIDSVYTLFNYEDTLIQTELALRRLKDFLGDARYPRVFDKIKEALGLCKEDSLTLAKGGGVHVSGPTIGKAIPLEGWADGYRKTLAWILDFYAWAMRANCITKTGDIRGILLVDELEQHLHPSMQTMLPTRLSELLPHVQLIATTHSPLVALGAEPDEVVVLKREGRTVAAHEAVRDFKGYSVEDILSDPKLFDADVYGPELSAKLARYQALASKLRGQRTPKEQKELQELGIDLAAQEIPEARMNPAWEELRDILKKHNL